MESKSLSMRRWSAYVAGARKGTLKFELEKCPLYARLPHPHFPCSTVQQVQASTWNNIQMKELNSFVKSERYYQCRFKQHLLSVPHRALAPLAQYV